MAGERWVWQSFGALEHSVRTGRPAFDEVFGAPLFDYYVAHPDAARVSAEGLKSVGRGQDAAVVAAYDFAGAGTVVDVGGGRAAAGRHPRGEPRGPWRVLDLPHVAAMARKSVEAAGLSARCRVEAGDFFARFPRAATLPAAQGDP